MSDEQRIDRMAGCACLGKIMLAMGVLALILFCLFNLRHCIVSSDSWPDDKHFQTKRLLKDLGAAIHYYEMDFNRLPTPQSGPHDQDLSVRTRGPFLTMLIGKEGMPENFQIKFIDPPLAKNHIFGLWRDGSERVLSDFWSEPYYIVLDANGDGKIANPEFGADQSNTKYATKCKTNPPPATLESTALIYSSGPDRDPKTWNDNICSWRD